MVSMCFMPLYLLRSRYYYELCSPQQPPVVRFRVRVRITVGLGLQLGLQADYTARVTCASVAKYILKSILFNYCTHTARAGQWASAWPRAKIEVSSMCDTDHAASPASLISSLVIPTWVTERRTRSVVVMHLIYESCQSQNKVKRRKSLGEMTRKDSVDHLCVD